MQCRLKPYYLTNIKSASELQLVESNFGCVIRGPGCQGPFNFKSQQLILKLVK